MKAARIIVALYSLWILLSHPRLPSVAGWPAVFWKAVPHTLLLRFAYFRLNEALEWILFAALLLVLVAVLFGLALRYSAFAAGLLLYHVAPLDALLSSGDLVGLGGLTVPTFFFFALWAADFRDRWPLMLAQFLLGASFFFSGVTKLTYVGWRWYTPSNIAQTALTSWSLSGRPAALWIASHASACWAIAIGSALLDAFFVVAFASRPIRWVVVPLAVVATVVRSLAFGVHWLAAPLLLLFIVDLRQCAESPESSTANSARPMPLTQGG